MLIFQLDNGAFGSPLKFLSLLFILLYFYGFFANIVENIKSSLQNNVGIDNHVGNEVGSSDISTVAGVKDTTTNSKISKVSQPDDPFWTEWSTYNSIAHYSGNYYHEYETHIRRIKHLHYDTFIEELDPTCTNEACDYDVHTNSIIKRNESYNKKRKFKVTNSHMISAAEQMYKLNETLVNTYSIRRAWSADADRLRYYFGGRCISKIRRGSAYDKQFPQLKGLSTQEVSFLCCNSNPLIKVKREDVCHELILPLFVGLDIIEDIAIVEDLDVSNIDFLVVYVSIRNDNHIFRKYRYMTGEFVKEKIDDFTKIRSKEQFISRFTAPPFEVGPVRKSINPSKENDFSLTNTIGLIPYRNKTGDYVLVLTQDVRNDPLRVDPEIGDIDLTSYGPGSTLIHHGKVGIPPYLTYFLSGTIRDEVYRSQPILFCSRSNNCVLSFLFGLFLSIDIQPTIATISVVDYREFSPELNFESLFTKRIIFKKSWIPPLVRLSNDRNHIALADPHRQRVMLFKRDSEQVFQMYGEFFENGGSRPNSKRKDGPREFILDFQFEEINGKEKTVTVLQILYRGWNGPHSHFYPLAHVNQSYTYSIISDIVIFLKSKWELFGIIFSLTIAFVVNELVIWKRNRRIRPIQAEQNIQESQENQEGINIVEQDEVSQASN